MPRVSAAFFLMGILFVFAGMALGQFMAASHDMMLAPVHAHLNLLGWATMALYGTFYALTKDGRYAGACAYEGTRYAVCDEKGPRLETCAYLFKQSEQPRRG